MYEIIFLLVLGFVWVLFASVQDLKSREVANWLSFSLIIFALGFRFFYSFFSDAGFGFFYQGLIGLGIFYVLENLFYYARIFAGGDAKLMLALGTILPLTESFRTNVKIFILFFAVFLFAASVYGIVWAVVLSLKNSKKFKKEFGKILKEKKKYIFLAAGFGVIMVVLSFYDILFLFYGLLLIVFPFIYFYAKAIDEVCMIKKVKVKDLTEGDWLYEDLKVGRKVIKKSWDGLSQKEIEMIKKKFKEVEIRQGIPFVPVFLICFLAMVYLYFTGFMESFLVATIF